MLQHLMAVIAASIKRPINNVSPPQFIGPEYAVLVQGGVGQLSNISRNGEFILGYSTDFGSVDQEPIVSIYNQSTGQRLKTAVLDTYEPMWNGTWCSFNGIYSSQCCISDTGQAVLYDSWNTGDIYYLEGDIATNISFNGPGKEPSWWAFSFISKDGNIVISQVQDNNGSTYRYFPYMYNRTTGQKTLLAGPWLSDGNSLAAYCTGINKEGTIAFGSTDLDGRLAGVWDLTNNTLRTLPGYTTCMFETISLDSTKLYAATFGEIRNLLIVRTSDLTILKEITTTGQRIIGQSCISGDFSVIYYTIAVSAWSEYVTALIKHEVASGQETTVKSFSNGEKVALMYVSLNGDTVLYNKNYGTLVIITNGVEKTVLDFKSRLRLENSSDTDYSSVHGISQDGTKASFILQYQGAWKWYNSSILLDNLNPVTMQMSKTFDNIYAKDKIYSAKSKILIRNDGTKYHIMSSFNINGKYWKESSVKSNNEEVIDYIPGTMGLSYISNDGNWRCKNNAIALDIKNNLAYSRTDANTITDTYFRFVQTNASGNLLMLTGSDQNNLTALKTVQGALVNNISPAVSWLNVFGFDNMNTITYYTNSTLKWAGVTIACNGCTFSPNGRALFSYVGLSPTIRKYDNPTSYSTINNIPPTWYVIAINNYCTKLLLSNNSNYRLYDISTGIVSEDLLVIPYSSLYYWISEDFNLLGVGGFADTKLRVYSVKDKSLTTLKHSEGGDLYYVGNNCIVYSGKLSPRYNEPELILQYFSSTSNFTTIGNYIEWDYASGASHYGALIKNEDVLTSPQYWGLPDPFPSIIYATIKWVMTKTATNLEPYSVFDERNIGNNTAAGFFCYMNNQDWVFSRISVGGHEESSFNFFQPFTSWYSDANPLTAYNSYYGPGYYSDRHYMTAPFIEFEAGFWDLLIPDKESEVKVYITSESQTGPLYASKTLCCVPDDYSAWNLYLGPGDSVRYELAGGNCLVEAVGTTVKVVWNNQILYSASLPLTYGNNTTRMLSVYTELLQEYYYGTESAGVVDLDRVLSGVPIPGRVLEVTVSDHNYNTSNVTQLHSQLYPISWFAFDITETQPLETYYMYKSNIAPTRETVNLDITGGNYQVVLEA